MFGMGAATQQGEEKDGRECEIEENEWVGGLY